MNLEWITNLPPQLATFILAGLPVSEERVSIPLALGRFHLPVWQAFGWSVLGNFLPGLLLIYWLEPISNFLRKKFKPADLFFIWIFAHTRKKFNQSYETWGKIGLVIFIGIPLPGTGVWTGATAAWLFGLKKKEALFYVALGDILAGVIVTSISLGVIKIFNLI
jgi:uncharacterized membrane protein